MKRWIGVFSLLFVLLVFGLSMSAFAETREVPGTYGTIQLAIDAAVAGDIINVAAGTYTPTSTININKNSLTLLGPQANVDPRPSQGSTRTAGSASEAIIDGTVGTLGYIIYIDADNVVINGLEVKSGTEDMIRQSNPHSGTVVKYCIIHDGLGDEGAQFKKATNAVLEYNYVFEIADPGDALNIADNSSYGVIRYNEVAGIHGENAAIYIYGAEHMEIIGNLVRDSASGGNDGIKVGSKDGSDATKTDVLIKDNVIHDITQDGISVYMSGVTVEGNEVYNSSSENGSIYLAWAISDITIQNNSVHDNVLDPVTKWSGKAAGILIGTDVDASTVTINFNNIYNNTPYGVTNEASAMLDATNNWWDSASGPDDDALVINGTGDKISTDVDADPWITGETENTEVDALIVVVPADPPPIENVDVGITVDIAGAVYENPSNPEGTVVTFDYKGTPETEKTFLVGTGKTAMKYVDVYVTGLTVGTATIKITYTDADLAAANIIESTVNLYMWYGGVWNLGASPGRDTINNEVWGTFNVTDLTGTPGAPGGDPGEPVIPTMNEWGMIIALFLLASAGFMMMRKRKAGSLA